MDPHKLDILKHFVNQTYESSWEVELTLILASAPDQSFTCDQLSKKLPIAAHSMESYLRRLAYNGLIVPDGTDKYRYAPQTEEKRQMIGLLGKMYRENSLAVIRMIYEQIDEGKGA
jgi:hypothetical protein